MILSLLVCVGSSAVSCRPRTDPVCLQRPESPDQWRSHSVRPGGAEPVCVRALSCQPAHGAPFCPSTLPRSPLGSRRACGRVPASLPCPPHHCVSGGGHGGQRPPGPRQAPALLVPVLGKACLLLEGHTATAVSEDLLLRLCLLDACLHLQNTENSIKD